jgi:hypothetical protein
MQIARSTLIAATAALVLCGPALAQQAKVTRVTGTVTAQTYPALAAFLQAQFDNVVQLSLTFPGEDAYAPGVLQAYEEGGMFLSYLGGPGGDSQISALSGYVKDGDDFVFDRAYKVTYAGMGQGIVAIALEPTMPPPGVPVETVAIDRLPAP